MTDEEVNKIIAEFMGYKFDADHKGFVWKPDGQWTTFAALPEYTSSLDALVPVWDKLYEREKYPEWDCFYLEFGLSMKQCGFFAPVFSEGNEYSHTSESEISFQQAAAHATAKAILKVK